MKRQLEIIAPNMDANKPQKPKRYGDPKLVARIHEYLAAQGMKAKRALSTDWLSDELQSKHAEYGRRKKVAFKKSVEKAYEFILEKHTKPDAGSDSKEDTLFSKRKRRKGNAESAVSQDYSSDSSEDSDEEKSFSSDNQDYVTYPDSNSMNSFMTNMYKRSTSQPSSRAPSAASSPHRPSDAPTTIEGLEDKALFVLDRSGYGKKKAKTPSRPNSPGLKTQSPVAKLKPSFMSHPNLSSISSPSKIVSLSDKSEESMMLETSNVTSSTPFVSAEQSKVDEVSAVFDLTGANMDVTENEKVNVQVTQSAASPMAKQKKLLEKAKSREGTPEVSDSKTKTPAKKRRKEKAEKEDKPKGVAIQQSTVRFSDIGGSDATLKEVCKLLVHMKHPEVYQQLGVTPPRGFLLHGPPGCGKTLLAHAIAGELELPFMKLAATEIVSGVSGESEEKVRETFDKAVDCAPCVLFIDEIDAITQKRETASKDMERRIVSQLLTCMDELNNKDSGHVLVIGATNRPDSLDPALRRAGRFDREICLGIPDESARKRILEVLCKGLRLTEEFDFGYLARLTPGFVGADLMALAREAAITAVNRVFRMLQDTKVTQNPPASNTPEQMDEQTTENIVAVDQTNVEEKSEQVVINSDTVDTQVTMDTAENNKETDEQKVDTEINEKSENMESSNNQSNCVEGDIVDIEKDVNVVECPKKNVDAVLSVVPTQLSEKEAGLQSAEEEFKIVLGWLRDQPPLTPEQLTTLFITKNDFEVAVKQVQPSAKREGFATIPDVSWDDIGALKDVREELELAIMAPVQFPEKFQSLGLTSPPGILLAGPPGCGKTLLAKAIANESGINFISVKGPELLNMYVGESERAVRQVFQRARNSSPCVIFFDELDALCPRRSDSGEGGSSVRVVNQLLTEMDGLEERRQVFVMGATNRPDIIDPAVMRPGRLDKQLYVGLPGAEDRIDIFRTITKNGKKPLLSEDVDLKKLAEDERCDRYTGADLAALVREAAVTALKESMLIKDNKPVVVATKHFDIALKKVIPSVNEKDQLMYLKMKMRLAST